LNAVFATDLEGNFLGSVSTVRLLRADPGVPLADVVQVGPAHVHADWDVNATARKMSDFNLIVAPVMDADHRRILGVVTVDDVLELLLPSGWRRDFGVTTPED
jgi:Mg/Co/Ni transporter MgtE